MRNIVLIGYQGVGKTYYGKRLAVEWGMEFIDTDRELERGCGESVREFQGRLGEKGFREEEKKVLVGLQGIGNTVIATGGGVVEIEGAREILRGLGEVIYLYNDLEVLKKRWKRVGNFYKGMTVEEMFERRCRMYEESCNDKVEGTWDQILLVGNLR